MFNFGLGGSKTSRKVNLPKTIDQQLYKACTQGKIEEVKQLLTQPTIRPNYENFSGQTPFWTACYNGQTEVVKVLLNDERVDVNKTSRDKETPFWAACRGGHIETVKLLLNDERINVNEANSDDQTPFWIACNNGKIEIVKLLLNDERIDINRKNQGKEDGFNFLPQTNIGTPFLIACKNGIIEIVQYILASGREVDLNEKDNQANTLIGLAKKEIERIELQQKLEQGWRQQGLFGPVHDSASEAKKKQGIYIEIIELLESFEKNPTETRTKLRNQLGLPDINFLDGRRREKSENRNFEEKREVEERKNQSTKVNPKGPEYEIEFNNEVFILQTTAKTLPELEIAIKSKLKLEQSEKIRLSFKRKGKLIVLDDLEFLKEGMTVKVSIISQLKPNPGNQIEYFQLKNWNEIVFLSQGANDEYRIEIDPDEIPPQIKNQIVQLMDKSSKLETCLRFQSTIRSNIVFQIDFQTRIRADKVFEQIVDILESN